MLNAFSEFVVEAAGWLCDWKTGHLISLRYYCIRHIQLCFPGINERIKSRMCVQACLCRLCCVWKQQVAVKRI